MAALRTWTLAVTNFFAVIVRFTSRRGVGVLSDASTLHRDPARPRGRLCGPVAPRLPNHAATLAVIRPSRAFGQYHHDLAASISRS